MGPWLRFAARAAFYTHLWIGVVATVILLTLATTGILLNHKKLLGYQPDPTNAAPAALEASLPLSRLLVLARSVDPSLAEVPVDRMDVRPGDGLVKVRFDDPLTTEVALRLDDGRVLSHAARGDVFLERLHTGELFGDRWILLSDAGAVALLTLLASGFWLWLFPRWRQ